MLLLLFHPPFPSPTFFRQVQVVAKMASGGSGNGSVVESGSVRALALAMADAVVGAEAMDAVCSAVSILASANDLANGRLPRGQRGARGELELDVDEL